MRTIDDLVRDRPVVGNAQTHVRQEPLAAYLARGDHRSSSTLRRVLRSGPAAADVPFDDDGSQRLARALHALVFEPARFANEYLLLDRDAPPADAQIDALDRIWITGAEYARLAGARDAIRAYPRAPLAEWIDAGMKEMSVYWTDEAGQRWKARPDCFGDELILELKTTATFGPRVRSRPQGHARFERRTTWTPFGASPARRASRSSRWAATALLRMAADCRARSRARGGAAEATRELGSSTA
jgi:hypothetical protein